MKSFIILTMMLLLSYFLVTDSFALGDLLNEAEIQPVPDGMTFEEYRDANRRILSGIIISSLVPVPGIMHLYAGEKKTGYRLMGGTGLGLLSIIAGIAALSGESDEWADSDYNTLDIGKKRYEKIPIFINEDGDGNPIKTGYRLKELDKKHEASGAGVALIIIGGGAIIFSHFYDWIHGIHMIELKRDRVRYKYGKELDFSMEPLIIPEKGVAGVTLGFKF